MLIAILKTACHSIRKARCFGCFRGGGKFRAGVKKIHKEIEISGLPKKRRILKPENFEQTDIGIYECKSTGIVWGNPADISIICYEDREGCDAQTLAPYADLANQCLDWIGEKKESIQKIILENQTLRQGYGFGTAGEMWPEKEKCFLENLELRKIEMGMCDEAPREISACVYLDTKAGFFPGHCHWIEVDIQAGADGTYRAEIIEDTQQLLLEIRDALKRKKEETLTWAEKNRIFCALDDADNMLATVRQVFCLSADGRLVLEAEEDGAEGKGSLENGAKRNALYFIRGGCKTEKHSASSWKGLPMPLGFVPEKLICENGVFTVAASGGHRALEGTFFVMQETLTLLEMLYRTRGVTEEEIRQCYDTFLAEDHKRYMERNRES